MGAYWESKKIHIAAYILPALALFYILIIKSGVNSGDKIELTVPIEGYDPRDLLSGHYLNYWVRASRYSENSGKDYSSEFGNLCACFSREEIVIDRCSADSCSYYVPISRRNGLLFASEDLQRYYIPDKYKNVLTVVPPHSKLKVAVKAGSARALQMYVFDPNEGRDLTVEEWAKSR